MRAPGGHACRTVTSSDPPQPATGPSHYHRADLTHRPRHDPSSAALARRHTVQDRLALSSRESQVLRLLRDGLSIPAIALEMYISHSTAKTYVARLYKSAA